MTASRDGANASYTVAGDATVYSSHTNVASDGLPGVEMTFKSTGTSTVTVSTPSAKPDDVAAKLKAFVSAYNDAVDLVRSKLTEKRVVNPQSDDDAQAGRALRRRLARRRADEHAPGDLDRRPGRPGRQGGGRPAAAPRPTRWPASSPSTRRPSTPRGPPSPTAVKAKLGSSGRLGLRAVLRGPARPDHARRRRPHGPARRRRRPRADLHQGQPRHDRPAPADQGGPACASSSPRWSRPSPRRSRSPPASPARSPS